jgi:ABC-2 type transport system permease protein
VNRHVLVQALRQAARTMVALCVGAALFFYLVLASSSSFLSQAAPDTPWLRNPPRAMRALLGGSTDFFDPAGWVVTGMAHPITLALFTAAALNVAAGGVAAEVERGTIDFVLSRPVSRRSYLTAILVASLLVVTAVELSGFLSTLLARQTVTGLDQLGVAQLGRVFFGSWTLFAAISAVAVLISANVSYRGRALALSAGFVVLSFFANFAALMLDQLYRLRRVSIFHYFQPAQLIGDHASMADLIVPAGLGTAAAAAALVSFSRRDIVR